MSIRSLLCLTAFLPVLSLAQDKVHMRIYVNGSAVGENTYEVTADGAFTSKSLLDLGSMKFTGNVVGHFKNGKLADATSTVDAPGGVSKVVFEKGRVTVTTGGKTQTGPYMDKSGILGANLQPQFWSQTLTAAEKAVQGNSATKSANFNAYFVDAGAVIPVKITVNQPLPIEIAGAKVNARRFTVEVSGAKIDFVLDPAGHVVAQDIGAQRIRLVADGWDAIFVDPMAKFPELSQATYKTKTERGVHVRMRDGVELLCDVVRPDDNEKHPAILVRTPYGRGSETLGGQFYASRGYVYVTQDCRGREDSYGLWDPFVNEGPDGYDTIQWISVQPWSDAKVGMIGGSYAGLVQWSAAVLNPPALKCIVPQVSPPDGMRNIPFDHGIFYLYGNLWWAKIVSGRRMDVSSLSGPLPHPEKFSTLPLEKVDDAVLGRDLEFFNKWLSRPTLGDWKGMDFTHHLQDATVPALHISGTWDGDEIGTHINWARMRELKRDNQWIIFGPWVHAFNTNHSFGDVEYGPDAIIDLDSVFLRWFDTWLKGKQVGLDKVARAKVFVTGANKWVELPDWPAPSTPPKTLYLSKKGLVESAGAAESLTYTYDPAKDNVVPKELMGEGGATSTKLSAKVLRSGLFLKGPLLSKDTAIIAPIEVKLNFTSSAVDTDFFAYVVDVAPTGETRIIGQPGKIRGSYLGGMDAIRLLAPSQKYTATITPWDFAHEFKKGHRLGVFVISSMFPLYARNLGTGEPAMTGTKMVSQKNTI
jgi:uncharacterized protein